MSTTKEEKSEEGVPSVKNEPVKGGKTIQSVIRALEILEFISVNGNNCRLQEISRGIGVNKSTVHTLLSTLEQKGYAVRDSQKPQYSLGINCMRLGITYRRDLFAREKMNSLLTRLADQVGETCYFSVRVDDQYFYLDAVAPDKNIRADTKIGFFKDLHQPSAISKVFLRNEVDASSPANNYEVDFEEEERGMNSFAIPIKKNGNLIGAISVSGPSNRFGSAQIESSYRELIELLGNRDLINMI